MAVAKKWRVSSDLKKLVSCNMELDLIGAEVKALKEGLISKDVFDSLMPLKPKVPIAKRYCNLFVHVHETLQDRLSITDVQASATRAVSEGLIVKNILINIMSLNEGVPAALKARYLLLFLKPALQQRQEQFMSHLMKIHSVFTNYETIWSKLNDYITNGHICESILTPLFPKLKKEKLEQNEEKLKELIKKEKNQVRHSLNAYSKLALSKKSSRSEAIVTLGPQHLLKVNELLFSYSYNWKNIGIALKFQPQDLLTIETTPLLIPGAPKSYLNRLLQDWLQMTLRHTSPPTVENLKKALASQTVGLGALGCELQAIFSDSTHSHTEFHRSYSSTLVSFDAKEPSVYPKCNEIYLKEGESTLLEVKATTANSYKWVKGKKLYGEESILYFHKADIAWDGEDVICLVESSLKKKTFTVPITVHVSCFLDEFTPSLSSMYLCKPEVPEDTWPPTGSSTKYINLAVIKLQKINYSSECVRATIRGDIDDVLHDKEILDYTEMCNSLRSESQIMFIEGRPGSGKTTFVHKVTRDWASNSSGGIRLLLLVSLRVLNTIPNPNLSDILVHLFRDLKVTPEMIEKRDGKGVCFIFDGLDEFSPSDGKDSIVYKIIDRSYLHQSTVVVASRPAALAELRKKANKIVEVLGFTSNQIQEYFDHYPFSDATKPVTLKAYLSLHPNILHMCYLPIHATMVAFLFEVTGQVPKTETKIYSLFTQFTLMRSISEKKKLERSAKYDILQCLNDEERQYFNQTCQLALEKTVSNKQVLDHDEISFIIQATENCDFSLGLITVDRTADFYGFKDIYTFLHLTFQEYLAAYHISTLSGEEQMKLIEEHGHKNHMLVVWKFFFGLVQIKPFDDKFKTILCKTQDNILYHFQCAYESQQNIVCVQLLKAVHYDIKLGDKFLSTPDFTAIGYATNKTILPTKLTLTNCSVDVPAIDALLSEMEDTSKQSIESLHIKAKDLAPMLLPKLLANFQSLKSLSLVNYSDTSQQAGSQHSSREQLMTSSGTHTTSYSDFMVLQKLQALTLGGFQEESGEFQEMMLALRHCENLTEFNLTDNKLSSLSAKHLSKSLPGCKSLQKVDISNNDMPSDKLIEILHSMKSLKIKEIRGLRPSQLLLQLKPFICLQYLDQIKLEDKHAKLFVQATKGWKDLRELNVISEPKLTESVSLAVSRALQQNFHNIETLILKNSIYNIKVAKSLAAGLENCPNLKVLNLSNNFITAEQLEVLLCLKFSNLEELYFDSNAFCDKEIVLLSSYLKEYQSLKVLSLGENFCSNSGAMTLAAELHHCSKLVKLYLQTNNRIGDDAARAVAAGLKSCYNMQLLCLPHRNCQQFASTYMQEKKQDRKKIFGCGVIQFE